MLLIIHVILALSTDKAPKVNKKVVLKDLQRSITWNESSIQCNTSTDEFQCDYIALALPISFPVPFNIKRCKHISIHRSN